MTHPDTQDLGLLPSQLCKVSVTGASQE